MRKQFTCNRPGQRQKFNAGKKAICHFHGKLENQKVRTKSNNPNQEINDIKKKNKYSFGYIEDKAKDINNVIGYNSKTPSKTFQWS